MANYQNLLNTINGAIQTNGTGAITGQLLQTVLDGMVASLGAKYQYAGIATLATNPGTPDENVFYIATQAGTYTNFGGMVVNDGEVCALKWDGTWAKDVTGAATAEQVSQLGQKVDAIEGDDYSPILNLENGGINASSGRDSSGHDPDRLRTTNYIFANALSFVTTAGKAYFFAYDKDKNYISSVGWCRESRLIKIVGAYYYRIVFATSNDANISPEDYPNLGITTTAIPNINSLQNLIDIGYSFVGVAKPSTNPGTPDKKVFYLTSSIGEYTNFGVSINSLSIIYNDNGWKTLALGSGYKTGRINYSGEHSSLLDEVVFSGKSGQTLCVNISTSSIYAFRLYARKNGTDVFNQVLTTGINIVPVIGDFDRLGFYHSGDNGYVDYDIFTIQESAPVVSIIPHASGKPNIDTNLKVLDLNNCLIIIGGASYEMSDLFPNNPEKYRAIPLRGTLNTSATKIVFDYGSKQFLTLKYDSILTQTQVVIGSIRTNYSTKEFISGNFIFEYTIDNKEPWHYKVSNNYYNGERLIPHCFKRTDILTFEQSRWHQSIAIYENLCVQFDYGVDVDGNTDPDGCVASLYDMTGSLLSRLAVPYGSFAVPHCNTAVFGIDFYSEESIAPMLYLSQWNGEKGCLVYDIKKINNVYSIDLVQTITTSGISADIEGIGMRDWVVDNENRRLYSFGYKIDSDRISDGNGTMIMCFDLPDKANENVILTESDIINHFESEFIKFFQDKFFKFGRIYIAAGMHDYISDTKIIALDISAKKIVTTVPLGYYWNAEPEGLDYYKECVVYTTGSGLLYQIDDI